MVLGVRVVRFDLLFFLKRVLLDIGCEVGSLYSVRGKCYDFKKRGYYVVFIFKFSVYIGI